MTSAEKIQNCFECKPIKDRSEIPVYPMLISYPGVFAGITQKQIFDDPKKGIEALHKTYEHFGYPDLSMFLTVGDVIFAEGLPAKRPGYELPDDAQFQLIETPNMNHDDYREIRDKGWPSWYDRHMCRIQNPPYKSKITYILRWIKLGMNAGKYAKFLRSVGVEPIAGTAIMPLFDWLSLTRSFEEFIMDLYEEPDLIKQVLEKQNQSVIDLALKNIGRTKEKRILLFAMRSEANSISPALFDEFVYPYLKEYVKAFHAAGYRTVLHADGNWIPMLDRFLDLPKGSIHFEFDGLTDMFKASEILDGQHSFRGDVPATMFALGTPDEVSEYCEKLITGIGMKGGFVLGSGCEIPMNCKPENLMAMMKMLRS